LLVVLGDHGMDRKGDHGGDGALETSSALWIYSKGIPLFSESMSHQALPRDLRPQSVFPGMDESFRSIQQIDLVPSLALLLGVPIPHNSLGAVIPELFMRIADGKLVLDKATMLNVNQMNGFMQAYRSSPSGSELEPHWRGLRTLFADAISKDAGTLEARFSYLRVGLDVCRQLWAQFDSLLMLIGLGIMASTVIALVGIISPSSRLRTQTEDEMRVVLKRAVVVGLGSGLALGAISAAVQAPLAPLQSGLAASATGTSVFLWTEYSPLQLTFNPSVATVIYILHFLSFFSNSFVFWEERIVPFLLAALMVKPILVGVGAPHHRLRTRLVGFSLLFLVCVRLAANSTVCREEQQPYCTVTFYSSSSASAPPISMIVGSTAAAIALPIIIRRFLKISRADSGSAPIFLETILRTLLLVGMSCWLLEYWESVSFLGAGNDSSLRQLRSALARFGVASAAIAGPYYWFLSPLCLDIVRQEAKSPGGNPVVEVYGFANVFGSSYLLVASLLYALVCMSTQLTGQVVFALALTAALSWLEVVDTLHDSFVLDVVVTSASSNKLAESARSVSFSDTVPFALLGLHTFYGTGHQATLQSLQWKTAFVLTGSVVYPFSPITVALNTFGPQVFFSFSSILLGLWNIPPLPYAAQASFIEKNALQAFLGVLTYYTTLLLGSASAAAILRRHLMVWKVFAPRFMTSAASMLAIDIGGIIGLGLALPLLLRKGLVTFGKAK
jgi:phosphatidylinositol glycan class O